jgi:effector-binding domain-containing protein
MQLKQVKPMTTFYFSEQTDIAGLEKLTRVIARKLYKAAIQADLEITGPVYWLYYDFDGNPQKKFTLEIALPIHQKVDYWGEFGFKTTKEFSCASIIHTGSWYTIPQSYALLIEQLTQAGHLMSGNNREIYMYMDFNKLENNITEIQIGIQPS